MNDFPAPTPIEINGHHLATYRFGTPSSDVPPLVLIHGWPEIAYSWKHQLPALSQASFHGIAIDLPGFGASCPLNDISDYAITKLTERLCACLDALNIKKAIFCGHDWGGPIAWGMGIHHPSRVAGIIGVCTPHLPAPPVAPTTILSNRFGEGHYIVQFQKHTLPEQAFSGQESDFFRFMFRGPVPREVWPKLIPDIYNLPERFAERRPIDDKELIMQPSDIEVYADQYRKSGFTGGINLYRNIDQNWVDIREKDLTLEMPTLWIGAELDLFLPPESANKMDDLCPDLEKKIINGCGHWVTWQEPIALNRMLIDWLTRRYKN